MRRMKRDMSFLQISIISTILFFSLSSQYSLAGNEFWQAADASALKVTHQINQENQRQSLTSEFSDGDQTSISWEQAYTSNTSLYLHYANAQDERQWVLGTTLGSAMNNVSLSLMQGTAEDSLSLAGEYSGIDPYVFHGGIAQRLSFQGYALDYQFNRFGHLQYGEATVRSDGLMDRKAQYVEWSNNRFFARATAFERGARSIGNGFDAGFSFGNKQIAWQSAALDNSKGFQRFRLQVHQDSASQYWLDFSKHKNALYRDNDDYQMMFTFKTLLGKNKSWASAYKDEVDSGQAGDEDVKSGKGWKRAVFIGAGVAVAASLSSSGSSEQDDMSRFNTQRGAAFDVLNRINPTSVRENREYGGYVYVNADGSFASTNEVQGNNDSVNLPSLAVIIPVGSRGTATYHTHAAFDPRYDNENFSDTDLRGDRQLNLDGYLATPGGQFKFHNVSNNRVSTLGAIAN